MRLISIQIAQPADLGNPQSADPMDRPWRSGFFKQPVAGPQLVNWETIVGDGVADRKNHGGPDKAVLAYSADHYPWWNAALNRSDMTGGGFGENLTIAGQAEADVCVGDVYGIGNVEFEVSQPRQPCSKLGRRWRMKNLPTKVIENGRSGWYLRVRRTGSITAGDDVVLLDRPFPNLTINALNDMMYQRATPTREAIDCTALFGGWREHLARL